MVSRGGWTEFECKLGRVDWKEHVLILNNYGNDEDNGMDTNNKEETFPSVLMQIMMLEQDPYARWFTGWIRTLPPSSQPGGKCPQLISVHGP
jgi:hypothetical protein